MPTQHKSRVVIHLEENDDHAHLVRVALSSLRHDITLKRIKTIPEAHAAIRSAPPKMLIASLFIGGHALDHELESLRETLGNLPLLVLSCSNDAASAADAIKRGADDYLVKNRQNLKKLPRLVEKLLKQRRSVTKRRPTEAGPTDLKAELRSLLKRLDEVRHQLGASDPNNQQ